MLAGRARAWLGLQVDVVRLLLGPLGWLLVGADEGEACLGSLRLRARPAAELVLCRVSQAGPMVQMSTYLDAPTR